MCTSRVHILGRAHKMPRTVTKVERYQCIISTICIETFIMP
ncbi:hypothetical protein CLOHYLEM_07079 [[Clostridium] hylemonae DSM 15053]|uniref:Uncharacterized protein n=1 Tax=[Clostridium] hylemonae DSM 15053 TaxID=553973 RepID=C0C4R2_9FIRM|nr:hypothetical protein CLOHYLEM_07079 [[Clostridium] hylemonae DSM 15053]